MSADPTPRHVPCPTCGEPSVFARGNRWRPFCSQRCSGVDLGAWASEGYRVASSESANAPGDNDTPHQAPH